MQKLKEFDVDEFIQDQAARQDPTRGASLGELIKTFLDNQNEIGIRKFAERCGVRRHRIKQIMNGVTPNSTELEHISNLFAEISDMYTQRSTNAKILKAGLTQ